MPRKINFIKNYHQKLRKLVTKTLLDWSCSYRETLKHQVYLIIPREYS